MRDILPTTIRAIAPPERPVLEPELGVVDVAAAAPAFMVLVVVGSTVGFVLLNAGPTVMSDTTIFVVPVGIAPAKVAACVFQ